ncbi:hypothetical protein [Sorangium sp. So ce362]|uniref:hypothetical protein n=1 Tax=Sorangium sp. So ce362 TaxID=3133303 RepID=UPI003F634572
MTIDKAERIVVDDATGKAVAERCEVARDPATGEVTETRQRTVIDPATGEIRMQQVAITTGEDGERRYEVVAGRFEPREQRFACRLRAPRSA